MLRAVLLTMIATVVVIAACSGGHDAPTVDAPIIDASIDAAGSGSATAMALEASPHDGHLDLIVVALGMVIVAPVRRSRRRRDTP